MVWFPGAYSLSSPAFKRVTQTTTDLLIKWGSNYRASQMVESHLIVVCFKDLLWLDGTVFEWHFKQYLKAVRYPSNIKQYIGKWSSMWWKNPKSQYIGHAFWKNILGKARIFFHFSIF